MLITEVLCLSKFASVLYLLLLPAAKKRIRSICRTESLDPQMDPRIFTKVGLLMFLSLPATCLPDSCMLPRNEHISIHSRREKNSQHLHATYLQYLLYAEYLCSATCIHCLALYQTLTRMHCTVCHVLHRHKPSRTL